LASSEASDSVNRLATGPAEETCRRRDRLGAEHEGEEAEGDAHAHFTSKADAARTTSQIAQVAARSWSDSGDPGALARHQDDLGTNSTKLMGFRRVFQRRHWFTAGLELLRAAERLPSGD